MKIIRLNDETIQAGKRAYRDYLGAVLCGSQSPVYDSGLCRDTGPEMIVGVIAACIEQGLTTESEILFAASRVSLCKRSTVERVLDELTGADPTQHHWGIKADGHFYDLRATVNNPGMPAELLIAA